MCISSSGPKLSFMYLHVQNRSWVISLLQTRPNFGIGLFQKMSQSLYYSCANCPFMRTKKDQFDAQTEQEKE